MILSRYQSAPSKLETVSQNEICKTDLINACFCSPVQKPEKLSSVCVAGALRDGLCAYTALHTHARMAAGHTLLVMDGASVCQKYQTIVHLGDIAQ